jgi:hypothetical protein
MFDFAKRTQFPFEQSWAWEFALSAAECICGVFSRQQAHNRLPDLLRLNRYKRRAAARQTAIRALTQSEHCDKMQFENSKCSDLAKRTQFLFEIRGAYCFDLLVSV